MENSIISVSNMPNATTYSNQSGKFIAFDYGVKIFIAWSNDGGVYFYDSEEAEELIDETLEYFENQYPSEDTEKFTVDYMHKLLDKRRKWEYYTG